MVFLVKVNSVFQCITFTGYVTTYITERANKNVFNKALGVNVVYLTDKEKLNQFLQLHNFYFLLDFFPCK